MVLEPKLQMQTLFIGSKRNLLFEKYVTTIFTINNLIFLYFKLKMGEIRQLTVLSKHSFKFPLKTLV